jgi:hypothetical protein
MAFGLSAGAATLLGSVAGPLVGGLLGSQSSGQTQTQQQTLDPRIQSLLYGDGGLLTDVNNLRKQQLAQGGLNPNQTAGLEMQRQSLLSPQYTQGLDQMRNVGSQLLGAGVAGNPFANGGNGSFGGMPNMGNMPNMNGRPMGMHAPTPMAAQTQQMPPMQPFQYQQNPALAGASNPLSAAPAYMPPAPAQTNTSLDDMRLKNAIDQAQSFVPNRGDR